MEHESGKTKQTLEQHAEALVQMEAERQKLVREAATKGKALRLQVKEAGVKQKALAEVSAEQRKLEQQLEAAQSVIQQKGDALTEMAADRAGEVASAVQACQEQSAKTELTERALTDMPAVQTTQGDQIEKLQLEVHRLEQPLSEKQEALAELDNLVTGREAALAELAAESQSLVSEVAEKTTALQEHTALSASQEQSLEELRFKFEKAEREVKNKTKALKLQVGDGTVKQKAMT